MAKDANGNEIVERDPMDLSENHFEEQENLSDKEFMQSFEESLETPATDEEDNVDPNAVEGETPEEKVARLAAEEEAKKEPFKFDDSASEAEIEELKELNAKLDTNYESMEDLKAAFKKDDIKGEANEIDTERQNVNWFKTYLDTKQYPDRRLVLEDLKSKARATKDISNKDVLEELEAEVQTLEDNGSLGYAARTIRSEITSSLALAEGKVNAFDTKQSDAKIQTDTQRKEAIQTAIEEVWKQNEGHTFLGVQLDKKELHDIYKDINKGKHIAHLKANPRDAVEFALFKKHREKISKALGKGDFNAGVKRTLSEIEANSSQSSKQAKANDDNPEELTFVQRMTQ